MILFADPELPVNEALKYYQHSVDWANRLILGDSLLVMNSLLTREHLRGKVQMIYMDPPYGIRFASNFQPFINQREVGDRQEDVTREPEMIRAFRDTWEKGRHTYLAYLGECLWLCQHLLGDTGSMFVQIGEENLHLARCLLDEVFGPANFVTVIPFRTASTQTAEDISSVCDYLLWYAKDRTQLRPTRLLVERSPDLLERQFDHVELPNGTLRKANGDGGGSMGRRVKLDSLTSQHESQTRSVPFTFGARQFHPHSGRQWAASTDGLERAGRRRPYRAEG